MPRVKRIEDCKYENGHQLYQVKWESSWETAESLAGYQDLVDNFWEYIHECRCAGGFSPKPLKKQEIEVIYDNLLAPFKQATNHNSLFPVSTRNQNTNFSCISSLTSSALSSNVIANVCHSTPEKFQKENQTEVMQPFHQVIKTEPDFESTCSFSSVNSPFHKQVKSCARVKGSRSQVAQSLNQDTSNKQLYVTTKSDDQVSFSSSSLESFVVSWENENPYCRIVFLCRSCNKEMNYKLKGNWKAHFITHMDVKPFQCEICNSGFAQKVQLINHMAKKHNVN